MKASGNILDKGRATLFKFDGYHYEFLRAADVSTASNGAYSFSGLENGYYLVHALPDTASAYFTNHIAAYYGNAVEWKDGKFVRIENQDQANINIDLIPYTYGTIPQGNDQINGVIVFDQASASARILAGSEAPVENAVVTLYNNSGDRLTSTYTDPFGNYSFDDLGAGEYYVGVEYAGTNIGENFRIDAAGTGESYDGSAVATKQEVSVGTLDKKPESLSSLMVYPNPVRDMVQVKLPVEKAEAATVKVYNLSGILQKEVSLNSSKEFVINVSELTEGIYLLNIESASGKWIARFNKH